MDSTITGSMNALVKGLSYLNAIILWTNKIQRDTPHRFNINNSSTSKKINGLHGRLEHYIGHQFMLFNI